jgi:hypothetical protein
MTLLDDVHTALHLTAIIRDTLNDGHGPDEPLLLALEANAALTELAATLELR